MRKVLKLASVLALAALCVLWLASATDYSDNILPGKYSLRQGGQLFTLTLKPDHTFQMEMKTPSGTRNAEGTWHHVGEGGVSFSKEFLIVPGEERGSDGTAFAEIHKILGISVRLEMRQYDVIWYGKPAGVVDQGIPGEYTVSADEGIATLQMKPDHTFDQTMLCNGSQRHASGHWTDLPSGFVSFSKDFLNSSCTPLGEGETAETGGSNGAFLQIEIANSSPTGKSIFNKRILPW